MNTLHIYLLTPFYPLLFLIEKIGLSLFSAATHGFCHESIVFLFNTWDMEEYFYPTKVPSIKKSRDNIYSRLY